MNDILQVTKKRKKQVQPQLNKKLIKPDHWYSIKDFQSFKICGEQTMKYYKNFILLNSHILKPEILKYNNKSGKINQKRYLVKGENIIKLIEKIRLGEYIIM